MLVARLALAGSIVWLAAGCAKTPAVRTLASDTAKQMRIYQSTTAQFEQNQRDLEAGIDRRMTDDATEQRRHEARLTRTITAWSIAGDQHKLTAYRALPAITAEQIVADLAPIASTARAAPADPPDMEKTAKLLDALAKKPSWFGQWKEIYDAGAAIQAAIADAQKQIPKPTDAPPATVAATPALKP